jgi:8-oxo-dGTP diphosphatase
LTGTAQMKKFPTATLVVAIALVDGEGRVLMQMRPRAKAHGGLWEFPGGKVEPGEGPESALVREIREELGLEVAPGDLAPLSFASGDATGDLASAGLVMLLYSCRRWTGVPRNLDAETIAWVGREGLLDLAMPPVDVPLAKKLAEALK